MTAPWTKVRAAVLRLAAAAAVLAALSGPAQAQDSPVALQGEAVQGGLMLGRTVPGAVVLHDGKPVEVAADGRFIVGFARRAGPRSRLEVTLPEGRSLEIPVEVAQRQYQVQRIDELPEDQVSPGPEALARIRREAALIKAARARRSETPLFESPFEWPVVGVITGVYGSRRILNGEPRAPHLGLDIATDSGAPVRAPTEGVVALVHDDMFFTGKTVIIDHGHGLTSVYAHMSEILVEESDAVERGAPIGAVGASGRATGPHLHWGVHLKGVGLDPALLAGAMPAPEQAGDEARGRVSAPRP